MLSLALLAAFAATGLTSPAPAPQGMDLAAVLAAPSPTATGPPLSAVTQASVYDASAAAATVSVSSISSASSSAASTTAAARLRRDSSTNNTSSASSSSHTFCWGSYPQDLCIGGDYDTASPPNFYPTTTILSTKTGTTTTSSSTACPTIPEAGTSCGFINPEDNCAPQPDGYGPHIEPDTVAAFSAYAPFHSLAQHATTPHGYTNTFRDLNASCSAASYLGLYTLSSYDVTGCSEWCDNTTLCTAFNIYIERDPALNPSASQCYTTDSITNYKCTLWGSSLSAATATNTGGWRGPSFQVVITASNGYDKSNSTSPGPTCSAPSSSSSPSGTTWTNPQNCTGFAHSHPTTCLDGCTGRFFPGPYNPQLCAAYADSYNSKLSSSSSSPSLFSSLQPKKCTFFNAWELTQDAHPLGTYCSLFAQQYINTAPGKTAAAAAAGNNQATYVPGWMGGKWYGVGRSWGYCDS